MLHEYPSQISNKQPPAVYGWILQFGFVFLVSTLFGKLITRSGAITFYVGTLRDVGFGGHYWTGGSCLYNSNSYYFLFYNVDTYPAYNLPRSLSFNLRCVNL